MIRKFFMVSFTFLLFFSMSACANDNNVNNNLNISSDYIQDNKSDKAADKIDSSQSDTHNSLIQVCPEAWYDNKMPAIVDTPNDPQPMRQYFIINGQRVETSEVDINWVMANCTIKKPSIIY